MKRKRKEKKKGAAPAIYIYHKEKRKEKRPIDQRSKGFLPNLKQAISKQQAARLVVFVCVVRCPLSGFFITSTRK
jgi:hypothetical protein